MDKDDDIYENGNFVMESTGKAKQLYSYVLYM